MSSKALYEKIYFLCHKDWEKVFRMHDQSSKQTIMPMWTIFNQSHSLKLVQWPFGSCLMTDWHHCFNQFNLLLFLICVRHTGLIYIGSVSIYFLKVRKTTKPPVIFKRRRRKKNPVSGIFVGCNRPVWQHWFHAKYAWFATRGHCVGQPCINHTGHHCVAMKGSGLKYSVYVYLCV